MSYDSVNEFVLTKVPPNAKNVLDIGCGGGSFGWALKQKLECRVTGITYNRDEERQAKCKLDKVVLQDLNYFVSDNLGTFDCIICCHVIEHLFRPEHLLEQLHDSLEPAAMLIVAVPNILFWKQRLEFLLGRFRYTEGGIMDQTHYRFYDWTAAQELLKQTGYQITCGQADGGFPLSRLLGGDAKNALNKRVTRLFPGIFGWQFVFQCQSFRNTGPVPPRSFEERIPISPMSR